MGSHEYQLPDDRYQDSEDTYARDRDAEHVEHMEMVRRERLAEHAPVDPKPQKRVKRREKPTGGWEIALRWRLAVLERDQGCYWPNPAECEGEFQAHHVATRQEMRRRGHGFDVMYDPRCGMGVCSKHHRQHHNRARPIRTEEVPAEVWGFLTELGYADWLDRRYPNVKEAA